MSRVIGPLKALEGDLRAVEQRIRACLRRRDGAVRLWGEVLFRGGGKRIRPALVLLSSRIFGPQPPSAVAVAAAVEMVHGASLLHDDVIDNTTLRRGHPTLNALRGNRFTVLLGDYLLTEALQTVCRLGQLALVEEVSQAVAEMTLGQIRELSQLGNFHCTEEEALAIIDGKTASLMAAGCRLGAMLAGAGPAEVEALGRFGRSLGTAFQVVDDVLDFWGDPEVLGKPVGSDLGERKYTLPFLHAYHRAGEARRRQVEGLLSNGRYGEAAFREVLAMMEECGSRAAAMEVARRFTGHALEALEGVPPGSAREALAELVPYVLARDR